MTPLVDGHNAIHRLGLHAGRREEERHALLHLVRQADPSAEVYFDARNAPAGLPGRLREEGVVVHYCRGREADREILDRVRDAMRPGELLVVSDDREVSGGARQLGARAVGIREFFAPAASGEEEKAPGGADGFSPEDFGLPPHVNLKRPPRDLRERG